MSLLQKDQVVTLLSLNKQVSRLASSLLIALGVPELITRDLTDLGNVALALLRDSSKLARFREKVEKQRLAFHPRAICDMCCARLGGKLFDMKQRTSDIERGLLTLWDLFMMSRNGQVDSSHDSSNLNSNLEDSWATNIVIK